MKSASRRTIVATVTAHGGILVFAVIALEVMIMISPFAFFFYSVFGPVFNWLDRFQATTWLTGFFLPHMILPPTLLLKGIRVLGSVLFLTGAVGFVVCALQVYLGKLLKWGIAQRGLYRFIRHPGYAGAILSAVSTPLILGSWWALIPCGISAVLYVVRTHLEDKTLKEELAGYPDYMQQTRSRLIPGVW